MKGCAQRATSEPSPSRGGLGGDGVWGCHSVRDNRPAGAFPLRVTSNRENRPASVRVPLASLRAGYLLLLVQEKDTPTATPARHPASRVRERRPGFADSASCADGERARIPARAPGGPPRPPFTVADGDPGESGALLRAEANSRVRAARGLCGREGRAFGSPGSLLAAASARREGPQGRREGSRRVCRQRRTRCRQTPERARTVTRAGCARDRGLEGALLFGDFLLGKQEKVTRSQGCERKTHGCGSVFAKEASPSKDKSESRPREQTP